MLGRVAGTPIPSSRRRTGEEGLALNGRNGRTASCSTIRCPGATGVGVLEEILELDPAANVIMLTGQGSETVAVEVMKSGARDYLTKDSLSPETLHRCIQNAIMHGMLETKLEQKRQSLEIFTRAMAHDLKEPLRTIKSFSRMLHGSAALAGRRPGTARLRAQRRRPYGRPDRQGLGLHQARGLRRTGAEIRSRSLMCSNRWRQSAPADRKPPEPSSSAGRCRRSWAMRRCWFSFCRTWCRTPSAIASRRFRRSGSRLKRMAISAASLCSDNGPGIDPEHRELIFQPFKRLVGRSIEGTGLGLAICRRIAQMHGGSIWCEAENGRGRRSSWNCRLPRRGPCHQAGPSRTAQERAEQQAEGPGRLAEVLLVEDSPADMQTSEDQADEGEKVSFNLHVASNGREAMRLLEERAPALPIPQIDLMLLDINMPIMDGFEVLQRAFSRRAPQAGFPSAFSARQATRATCNGPEISARAPIWSSRRPCSN
jgi:CheY-like chemotaxis protein